MQHSLRQCYVACLYSPLWLSYIVANKHSKQAMFAGFAGDVRILLPGKAKQPKELNHSYHLLSFL